jgi:hypothetical protein
MATIYIPKFYSKVVFGLKLFELSTLINTIVVI